MLASLTTTQALAAIIGLYFAAAGVGILVDRAALNQMMGELAESPILGYFGGLLAFALGAVIVVTHNLWTSPLAGFVSLVGWVALAEGILILAFRTKFIGFFAGMQFGPGVVAGFGVGTIIIGAVLLFAGLT